MLNPLVLLGSTGVSGSMEAALNAVKADALDVIATVAPIGISIAGAFLVWRYGMKFFKAISK